MNTLPPDDKNRRRAAISLQWAGLVSLLIMLVACGENQPVDSTSASESQRPANSGQPVVVYSSINSAQLTPVLEAYSAETGVKTELVSDDFDGLLRRMSDRGGTPVADILVSGNVASLVHAAEENLLRPVYTEDLQQKVSVALSDPDRYWFPLSARARVVIYNSSIVDAEDISTVTDYQSLADAKWRGRLCLSSSKNVGNQTLIALLIARHGERNAELIVRGWTANFVDAFFKTDEDVLRALIEGQCAVSIADTNTLVRFNSARSALPLAVIKLSEEVRPQIDVTGAGVTRHATSPEAAEALMTWLVGTEANALFAASGAEMPANADSVVDVAAATVSEFVADSRPVIELARWREEARLLAERARYP